MSEATVRIQVHPGIHLRETGGEGILYDTFHKKVHILNGTASFIWRGCCESKQMDEISANLCAVYGVPPEIAHADVETTLNTFAELELIKIH